MNIVETISASVVTSGILTGAVLWMARLWLSERLRRSIEHEYATRLESHKAMLKAEMDSKVAEHQAKLDAGNAKSLERTRADLQIAAAQRQLQHKHLQEREAEAIAETYENLAELMSKGADYVSTMESPSMGSKAERREKLGAALTRFDKHFRLHRLYLPKPLANSVQSFKKEIFIRAHRFMNRVEREIPGHDVTELWETTDEYMQKEAPALFDRLEAEFRRRLGQEESFLSEGGKSEETEQLGKVALG